ncbi:MAG: protein kinase [Candidatus Eisenbacteria bacterium]
MSSRPPEPGSTRDALDATLEAIADRTPSAREALAASPALAVIAAVAEGFRVARFATPGDLGSTERWGALELRETLGRGAFGEVRLAWDPALEREVALKLRHAESGVLRWLDEARALARVRHPNVVVVHGADLRDGRAGIWMERVPGTTLEARLATEGPLAPAEVARIGVRLASALRAVHAAGLLHGDIKTANVMWDASDPHEPRAVLMDFGAVRETSGDDLLGVLAAAGTPLALAPEQFGGAPPSEATDVYALGVLLYRLLTGCWPVEGRSLDELRAAHRAGTRAPLASLRRDAPTALVRAIERACAEDPVCRTASAAQLLGELRAITEPARAWRVRFASAAAVVAVAAAAAFVVPRLLALRDPAAFRAKPLPAVADSAWAQLAWSAFGEQDGSELAWHAVGIGDLDGDGCDEVAVSEVHWRSGEPAPGRVRVYFGAGDALEPEPRWSVSGTRDGELVGTWLAAAGDANGDGRPDLLVSAAGARGPQGGLGAVRLYLGDGRGLASRPVWTAWGPSRETGFGRAVEGGFDANGDGLSDVLVSADGDSGTVADGGAVRWYPGTHGGLARVPAWIARGAQPDANYGSALAAADVNGDRFGDVLVGASLWSGVRAHGGRVELYAGGPAGPSREPVWTYEGDAENARAGGAVALGDVDGDGHADAVVAETDYSSASMVECGRVSLFRGGPNGLERSPSWRWTGPATRARVGTNRVLARDLDGDGRAEIVIGAYGYRTAAAEGAPGLVAVFRGRREGPAAQPDWWATGARPNEYFGVALGATRHALLVGSPAGRGPAGTSGRVDLFAIRPAPRER